MADKQRKPISWKRAAVFAVSSIVALAVLGFSSGLFDKLNSGSETDSKNSTEKAETLEAKTYKYEGDGFSVKLLEEPEISSEQMTIEGVSVPITFYQTADSYASFQVSLVTYPQESQLNEDSSVVLEGAARGSISNLSGTLDSSENLEVQGNPARDVVISGKDSASGREVTAQARYILVDRTLYTILGLSEKGNANKDFSTYRDSFTLL
ncbi:hypothetical protein KBC31_03950 [Candidatus Saccharibacteria bacterium]|nr:hypothetical protein [Candidatus Saccharibacteria bacterium]